jgi:hypothetical protein
MPDAGVIGKELELSHFRELQEEGYIVLACNDCGTYWLPGPMRRYGDHACANCGSLSTGFVTEETL